MTDLLERPLDDSALRRFGRVRPPMPSEPMRMNSRREGWVSRASMGGSPKGEWGGMVRRPRIEGIVPPIEGFGKRKIVGVRPFGLAEEPEGLAARRIRAGPFPSPGRGRR